MASPTDYTVPCGKSKVHPDGICRKKLHKNVHSGLHRLHQRMEEESMQEQLKQRKAQFDEQRRQIDLEERMLGVGLGTHRVIKDTRKNKPKVDPYLPGGNAGNPNNKNGKKQ
jgi:hypothetical protein